MTEQQLPCGHCGKSVGIPIRPHQIINGAGVAIIFIEHGGETVCANCLTRVQPVVVAVPGFAIQLRPIAPKSNIVLPPTGHETN